MKGIRTILGAIAAALIAMGAATPAAAQTRIQSVAGLNPSGAVVGTPTAAVAGGDVTFSAAGQSVVIDAGGAGGVSLSVQGTWSGSLKVQWSDKGAAGFQDGVVATPGGSEAIAITANQQYVAPSFGRYLKITAATLASGSAVVTPTLATPRPKGGPEGAIAVVGGNFTTPAGTGAYSGGQLIANSATPGSVIPMSFAVCRTAGGTAMVRRARFKTPDSGFAGKKVTLKLYKDSPTATNGDHGSWLTTESNYVGEIQVTASQTFSDPLYKGVGAPAIGGEINIDCGAGLQTIFGLETADESITPQGNKTHTWVLEVLNP